MKKILLILGIILLLVTLIVGAYFYLYGTPTSVDDVFARFGNGKDAPVFVGNDSETNIDVDGSEQVDGTTPSKLRQITTRPVAGAVFADGGIRYVERGTGHLYHINLQTGAERIVSGTTNERTMRAEFSSTGNHVVLTSEVDSNLVSVLGTYTATGGGSLLLTALPPGATESGFNKSGDTLYFFVPTPLGGVAYAYTLATEKSVALFTTPLRDVRIQWGTPTYVYTTPSAYSTGYAYRVGKSGLEYVTQGEKGLMAFAHASSTIISKIVDGEIVTSDVNSGALPVLRMIPEKCALVPRKANAVVCASPASLPEQHVYPDDWFKGTVGLSDVILAVDSASSTVTVLSNLEVESGRPLDVSALGVNDSSTALYFINKYDNTLWLLDLR
jgi:hypothetical protein